MNAPRLALLLLLLAACIVAFALVRSAERHYRRQATAQDPQGTHSHPTPDTPLYGHTGTANTEGDPT